MNTKLARRIVTGLVPPRFQHRGMRSQEEDIPVVRLDGERLVESENGIPGIAVSEERGCSPDVRVEERTLW
jgi:hypothetical protein